MPLASIIRRFRGPTAEELDAVRDYRTEVEPAVGRLLSIRDLWLDLTLTERDDTRLANTASIYRWELARLGQRVAGLEAPVLVANAQRALLNVLSEASRGCQLLATGHRFHKSETVCDGQTLLVESAEEAERLKKSLNALLEA